MLPPLPTSRGKMAKANKNCSGHGQHVFQPALHGGSGKQPDPDVFAYCAPGEALLDVTRDWVARTM